MTIEFVFRRLPIVALSVGLALPALGQAAVPAYDAVSVKPHHETGDPMRMSIRISDSNDRYLGDNVSLKQLIQYAYDLKTEDQIVGAAGWMDSARFDVEAKIDAETVAAQKTMTKKEGQDQRRLMMRAMLADRFQLKVHAEKKELPVYALVIAKSGFRLKEADPNDTYANGVKGPDGQSHPGMMMFGAGRLFAQAVPIQNLANLLSQQEHRQVLDRTGLKGKYDISLKWAQDDMGGQEAGTDSGPSLFTALEEQLGLKLDSTKGLVDTIVIDHASQPTEN